MVRKQLHGNTGQLVYSGPSDMVETRVVGCCTCRTFGQLSIYIVATGDSEPQLVICSSWCGLCVLLKCYTHQFWNMVKHTKQFMCVCVCICMLHDQRLLLDHTLHSCKALCELFRLQCLHMPWTGSQSLAVCPPRLHLHWLPHHCARRTDCGPAPPPAWRRWALHTFPASSFCH